MKIITSYSSLHIFHGSKPIIFINKAGPESCNKRLLKLTIDCFVNAEVHRVDIWLSLPTIAQQAPHSREPGVMIVTVLLKGWKNDLQSY